jgi:hypothetical protein
MSIVKTRLQIRSLVTRRARVVDHANSHPTADLNIDLDDGYRETRQLVTDSKWATFLKTTGSLTLPLVPPTGENYVVIPVPTDCNTVKTVEVKRTTVWVPIEETGFLNLRAYNDFSAFQTRGPLGWTLLDGGTETTEVLNTGVVAAGVIALFPVPTTSGFYQVWYLPEFAGTSADSGAGGFYTYANDDQMQFHVYSVCAKLLISDNDSQGMLTGVLAQLARYEERIRSSSPTKAGPRTWRRGRNYNG